MNEAVLDSSAVLALLNREPGAEAVRAVLPGAFLSTVNAAEVLAKLIDRRLPLDTAQAAVAALRCTLVPFTEEQAANSAKLRPATRQAGLSLGDRSCLALAQEQGARVVTADRIWSSLDIGVEIEVIR